MSYAAWLDHFTHTIGSGEILHAVHQRRCAVLSCWGAPTQKKSLFLLLLLLFFQKKNIKFKVALRPRLGLKPMVISVSNMVAELNGWENTPCVQRFHSEEIISESAEILSRILSRYSRYRISLFYVARLRHVTHLYLCVQLIFESPPPHSPMPCPSKPYR